MPEHLKTLPIILVLASVTFVIARAPACAISTAAADFGRRRNLWFGITLIAFLAHNFWIYIGVAAALVLFSLQREPNKLAMYFLLLFAVPNIEAKISGLGLIEHFFTINYVRLLSLTILFPAFLVLRKQPDVEPFGRSLPDRLVAAYLILFFVLMLAYSSVTNTFRHGVLYGILDTFLPYYVASRCLKNLQDFRDALMAFVVAAMVLSLIGIFEILYSWLLYAPLDEAMETPWVQKPLLRGESLRAQASLGNPIPLGYVIAVAAGLFLYLRKSVSNRTAWNLGMVLLIAGLIAPLSRGPQVGAVVILLVFLATSRSGIKALVMLGVLAMFGIPVLLATPYGDKFLDYLPFIGTVDAQNVSYRQKLFDVAIEVVKTKFWFGDFNFLQDPVMQQLKNHSGIIDVVNVYIGVALERGVVGLTIFAGFFVAVASGIRKGMRYFPDKDDEHYVLGQGLLATLLGLMVIIVTLSNAGLIPAVYWPVAGIGVAYAHMAERQRLAAR